MIPEKLVFLSYKMVNGKDMHKNVFFSQFPKNENGCHGNWHSWPLGRADQLTLMQNIISGTPSFKI